MRIHQRITECIVPPEPYVGPYLLKAYCILNYPHGCIQWTLTPHPVYAWKDNNFLSKIDSPCPPQSTRSATVTIFSSCVHSCCVFSNQRLIHAGHSCLVCTVYIQYTLLVRVIILHCWLISFIGFVLSALLKSMCVYQMLIEAKALLIHFSCPDFPSWCGTQINDANDFQWDTHRNLCVLL